MLYLQRNNIEDFVEVYKLRKLKKLRTLSLNDNPMALVPHYRVTVIHLVPNLRKLDNVVVVQSERESLKQPLVKGVWSRLSNVYPEDFAGNTKLALKLK